MNYSAVENTSRHFRRKCIKDLGWKEITALIVMTFDFPPQLIAEGPLTQNYFSMVTLG